MNTPTLWYTNAPEVYDYSYVRTVRFVSDSSKWRLIEVSDQDRFQRFQRPRYGSGGCISVDAVRDTDLMETLGITPNPTKEKEQ
jgi:hypothetical protein